MSDKYQFKLPDIGEGIAEGTVGEWHVQEGDSIKKDEDLVQIENDKSVEELPSPVDGTIDKILVQPDETASVGQPLVEMTVADGLGNVDTNDAVAKEPVNSASKSSDNDSSEHEIYEFKLPDIGEGIAEGTVGEWHVQVGDSIKKDDDLVQIENDKSVEELPSPVDGTVTEILVQPDETASVGQPLVKLAVAKGLGNVTGQSTSASKPNASSATTTSSHSVANSPKAADHSVPVLAMPAVRKFARDHDVTLASVKGTGRHGQILKSDVEAFMTSPKPVTSGQQPAPASAPPVSDDNTWPTHDEKMTPVRKATAKAMIKSSTEIPMIHLFDEVNVDKLWDHRKKYKELAKKHNVHLTFMAYMTKALAVIMKEFPVFNATVDMDKHVISYRNYINVGIATDTDRGLFVPNIKHADSLSLFAIAKEISANTAKAKDGKLSADDMGHTGMSITNIGSIGGGFFTPLINWPEVAILGMGKISPEPVVENNQIKIAKVLKLSLAVDHRIIDGGTAQRAMNRLKELLADPELLLMEG
ncbi:2-oxo acid dehydrogenase subunit E2 [uncultured Limosilactobacillus sp.]|uniref:2-oxo acid dehydrogenase subunit E2 n=1 Tax=uncultured Limosilactobacillus sp. TaxID=2837629 RepID=UPI0025D2BF68|nr:2-oxo acid dehydrogenase subunit E2 [uncultured Limosilactobacillus sp.]